MTGLSVQPEPDRAKLGLTIPPVNYTQPIYYISNRFNVVGTDVDMTWPRYSKWLDYEAEFGVWIGRYAKNVTKENAMQHVFGYSVFNDFSARDTQAREMEGRMGPTKGKSFDSGTKPGVDNSMPTIAVNTIKDTTRGLQSSR